MPRFLFTHFWFLFYLAFPLLFPLCADGSNGGGSTDPQTDATTGKVDADQTVTPPIDIGAEIQKALNLKQKEWNEQFKKATGHESLSAFQEAEAKRKGETEKLLDQRNAELQATRGELDKERINSAILGAAGAAVDPAIVQQLLRDHGKVENGVVTINGKPPADAIAALLKDKPFLAKASGGTGSGAGKEAGDSRNILTRSQFDLLTPADRVKFSRAGGSIAG